MDKPAWQRVPTTPEEGLRLLELTSIAEASKTIEITIDRYKKLMESFPAFHSAIQWMYAGEKTSKKIPLPFDKSCQDANCDPDIMREKMTANMPEGLQRIAFRGSGFVCPFIDGRVCSSHKESV